MIDGNLSATMFINAQKIEMWTIVTIGTYAKGIIGNIYYSSVGNLFAMFRGETAPRSRLMRG